MCVILICEHVWFILSFIDLFLFLLLFSFFEIDLEQTKTSPPLISNNPRYSNNPLNLIEKLDNNRTIIHVGESRSSSSEEYTDTKNVNDIINRFNKFNPVSTSTMYDGQYRFTNDNPPILIYHLHLPFETLMDSVRIQSDPQLNLLKIFVEQQERNLLSDQQQNKIIIRSTSRICRLPRDHTYDFVHLRVIFLKDNFIRIELPTLY